MPAYQGTTARLRRTFHYPEEDSTDSQPEALDEQEQQDYINQLAAENAARDVQFRRFLLAIPLLATIPYLPALINPPTALLALLSLTSLFSTAYLLHHQPPASSGIPFLDSWAKPKTPRPTRPPSLSTRESPLETYLPYLNLGLGLVLILMAWAIGRTKSEAVWPGMGYLPLVVYGIILVSKMVMGSVDPEKELSSLKYDYKGA
ncbi:hypothetical protein AU210_000376 [Fusarium oxysporum f. sp. radicis-cucumerinum]|uniref:Uncharacterized protein n=1 Tax=Fusarium oxysporum f. sp. radicis-cucumerinum TaxID=327505 RepID=A0A2H3HRE7_FUSOX|nr:hypothetical protein AU210_000376 [Fusarium oxysporum f. sp. radicis-cucumerinum]